MAVKYYIALVLLAAACVCFGLSVGLEVAKFGTAKTSYFKTCFGGTCQDSKKQVRCDKQKQMIDAGRAFSIISTVFAGISAVVLGLRLGSVNIPKAAKFGLLAATLVFGAVNFSLGFSLFLADLCGAGTKLKSQTNAKIGPSAPLAVGGFVLVLILLIVECVMADPESADASSADNNKEQDNARAVEVGAVDKKEEQTPQPSNNNEEEERKKKEQQEAADKKRRDDEAAAQKRRDDEAAASAAAAADQKRRDEEAAAQKRRDDDAAAAAAAKKRREEEEAAAAAAAQNNKPQINWKEINAKLPYDKKNMEQKKRRFEMFDMIDTNKTGKVSLAEVSAGMQTVLGLGDKIDVPVVIKTAFDKAKVAGQKAGVNDDASGGDFIEKNEFRLFLMYTRMYFEMFQLFSELDESGDMRIELSEFEKAIPLLKTWGAKIDNAAETFKQIDANGGGKVLFAEFVDWALSPEQNLDCPDEDE